MRAGFSFSLPAFATGGNRGPLRKRNRVENDDGFDAIYAAIARSPAYRAAARELAHPLPEWVIPFSSMTATDAYRICAIPIGEDETLVDLGCGTGGAALWIAGLLQASVVGVDTSRAAIASACALAVELGRSERTRFEVADASTTGLADESVALAISFDALMFMRAGPVVKEVARILRPGGFFAFTVAEWISDDRAPIPTVERAYAPLLEENGLAVIQEMTLDPDRGLPLYRGLLARETELRAEMGPPAEMLLSQAREHLERAGRRRIRDVFFIARRPKESAG